MAYTNLIPIDEQRRRNSKKNKQKQEKKNWKYLQKNQLKQ